MEDAAAYAVPGEHRKLADALVVTHWRRSKAIGLGALPSRLSRRGRVCRLTRSLTLPPFPFGADRIQLSERIGW